MHWAAISGHNEIVKLLLDKGANVLAETTSNSFALDLKKWRAMMAAYEAQAEG